MTKTEATLQSSALGAPADAYLFALSSFGVVPPLAECATTASVTRTVVTLPLGQPIACCALAIVSYLCPYLQINLWFFRSSGHMIAGKNWERKIEPNDMLGAASVNLSIVKNKQVHARYLSWMQWTAHLGLVTWCCQDKSLLAATSLPACGVSRSICVLFLSLRSYLFL